MTPSSDALDAPTGATLSNWRDARHSPWAFRRISELMPTVPVAVAPGAPWVLPAQPQSFADFRLPQRGGSSLDLETFLSATATDALVVVHRGRLAFEFYDHGNSAQAPHILMSVTKSVVGLLVGVLHSRGVLDLDQRVSHHLPVVANTALADATLRELLDMRTGITLDAGQQADYDAATHWHPLQAGRDRSGLHAFFRNLPAQSVAHGGPFRYLSLNTDLLGWVIEQAAGEPFSTLLCRHLWQPLGAESEAYLTVDSEAAPRCAGGLCCTARDLARLGQVVAQHGQRDGVQIVPSGWIDDLEQGGDRTAWRDGQWGEAFAAISRNMSYRSGWYAVADAPRTLSAMGIHGQHLFVDREHQLVVAKLSSQAVAIDDRALALTHQAVGAFRRCLRDAG